MTDGEPSTSSNQIITSGFAVVLSTILNLTFAFLIKLTTARTLSTTGYGQIIIGISTLTLLKNIVLLGVDQSVARFLPRKSEIRWRRGVVVSAFQIVVPFSILVGVLVAFGNDIIATSVFRDPNVGSIISIFGIAMIFDIIRLLTISVTQGLERTGPKIVLDSCHPLIRLGCVITALVLGYGAIGVALAFLISNVVVAIAGIIYLNFRTNLFRRGKRDSVHRALLRFSVPLMIAGITINLYSNLDLIMLGYFDQTKTVGIYSAMYSLATMVSFFLSSFGYLYMPISSRIDASEGSQEIQDGYNVVATWTTFTTVPVFIIILLFPQRLIQLTFGMNFTDGAVSLVIIAGAYVLSAIIGPNRTTLLSLGYNRSIMIYSSIAFIINTILNLALIPGFSSIGAATATFAGYLLMNMLYSAHLYWVAGIFPRPAPRHITKVLREIRTN
jgi:O-antigen/teichoic acid export membrane protein